ncbi:MAG TPA: hypothetical protein VLX68_13370 [Chitinivibrionales bacterium]|nr:hypothetical protein [Chitinivibrionales bacterium]
MDSQFTKHTDQKHRIKLESQIIYALWMCRRAWAGADAPFEVRTALVGEGAEIKIKLKNGSGKTLEKKSDKIFANRYRGAIAVPSKVDANDMLLLEVELSKHGLSIESNQVPAGPPVQVESMEWDRTEVRRGDVVKLKARFKDLPDNTEALIAIYEYDKDGNHDPVCTIPTEINGSTMELSWEFVYGDAGAIPTEAEVKPYNNKYRHPEYFFVIVIDGVRVGVKQESGLLRFVDSFEKILVDGYGQLMKDHEVEIYLADGSTKKAKTDDEGKLTVKDVPPGPVYINYQPSKE